MAWSRPARTRMMGWRTNQPTQYFAAGEPPRILTPTVALPSPSIVSDFKNSTHTLNGASANFGDIWVFDPVLWGAVATPVAGVGLIISTSANARSRAGPKLTAAAFAAIGMVSSPVVVVLEYALSVTGTGEASIFYEVNDSPAFARGVGLTAALGGASEGVQVYNYSGTAIYVPAMASGFHRTAALLNLALGNRGLSTDGAATSSGVNDDDSTGATGAGILVQVHGHASGSATATLSKVTIYPMQPLAELPALSA